MTRKKSSKAAPQAVHKVIVSNRARLTTKYRAAFGGKIQPALTSLINADLGRGINTVVVYLDVAADMRGVGGKPVTNASNEQQNKNAIDAVYNYYKPDYLVILGAPDVIPHQSLVNPAFTPDNPAGDPDKDVPSDLPYACPGPYSRSGDIKAFLNPIRVVGRLPDINNGSNAEAMVSALNTAARFTSRAPNIYQQYLGVSAGVWSTSTRLSLQGAFGNATAVQEVPPQNSRWTNAQLAAASHFFNCHGANVDSHYYGQPADGQAVYPISHDASYIAGKIVPGTVCAAECCYGAELYDPAYTSGQMGIANQYMVDGAYGFFGSTTIAYGPSDSNAYADILCRDFFSILLTGASLGRAVLQARQNYIGSTAQLTAVDLKTIAQFYLLGDPSVQPVSVDRPKARVMAMKGARIMAAPVEKAVAGERAERRAMLAQKGLALAASVGIPGRTITPPAAVKSHLESALRELGVNEAVYTSYEVDTPSQGQAIANMVKRNVVRKAPRAMHLAIGRLPTSQGIKIPRLAGVEIVEIDGSFLERHFHSR